MSPAELSDDFKQWPKDPFKLLGVPSQTDERTLKRAYTQLIRRFKPENFPEHFKLIRAAYEQAQVRLEMQARFRDNIPDAPEEVEERSSYSPDTKTPVSQSTTYDEDEPTVTLAARDKQPPRPPAPSPWELAKQGDIFEAFARLKQTVEQGETQAPATNETFLQMYWLAKVFPELQESPYSWLAKGIRRFPQTYSVFDTFRQVVQADSTVALLPEITDAILFQPITESTVPYLSLHWQAIAKRGPKEPPPHAQYHELYCQAEAKHQSLAQILTGLSLLREKLKFDNETLWGRIVITAMECYLIGIYFVEQPLFSFILNGGLLPIEPYLEELRQSSHLHRSLENQLDRLDELNLMTRTLAKERVPSNPFFQKWSWLIQQNAVSSDPEVEFALPRMIADLVKNPIESLSVLDWCITAHPLHATLLCSAIQQYAESRGVDLQAEPLVDIHFTMPSKLAFMINGSYREDYRPFITYQAFRWSVQPSRVIKQTPQLKSREEALSEWVAQDQALNNLYLAWYAFYFVRQPEDVQATMEP